LVLPLWERLSSRDETITNLARLSACLGFAISVIVICLVFVI
jgi:hypothetical protein